jgi:hypothetical protein
MHPAGVTCQMLLRMHTAAIRRTAGRRPRRSIASRSGSCLWPESAGRDSARTLGPIKTRRSRSIPHEASWWLCLKRRVPAGEVYAAVEASRNGSSSVSGGVRITADGWVWVWWGHDGWCRRDRLLSAIWPPNSTPTFVVVIRGVSWGSDQRAINGGFEAARARVAGAGKTLRVVLRGFP